MGIHHYLARNQCPIGKSTHEWEKPRGRNINHDVQLCMVRNPFSSLTFQSLKVKTFSGNSEPSKEATKLGYLLGYKGKDINATASPLSLLGWVGVVSIEVNKLRKHAFKIRLYHFLAVWSWADSRNFSST